MPTRPNPATPRNPNPAEPAAAAAPATPAAPAPAAAAAAAAAPAEPGAYLTHLKLWLTGLVGVLVVLPSLVNAGLDVYSSLLKLPKTEAQRINEKLFREYFGKQPVATVPVPIKQNNGIVEVRFQIYDKGDVFVEFGSFSQWFPFPLPEGEVEKTTGFSLMSSAFAQTPAPAPLQGVGQYQQTDQMQDGAILREKTYANGVVESQVIDTRSGNILDSSARKIEPKQPDPHQPSAMVVPPRVILPIDLDQLRKTSQASAASAAPAKSPATLWREGLAAELAWCAQKDWSLTRYLCTYRTTNKWCEQAGGLGQLKECSP